MKIYCYHSPEKCRIESLKNNQLWFTKPNHFNDVFESKTPLLMTDTAFSTIDHHSILSAYMKSKGVQGQLYDHSIIHFYKALEELVGGDLNSFTSAEIAELTSTYFDKKLEQIGVSCFTDQSNNELMWAYYSKSHSGFCIGYEVDAKALKLQGYDLRSVNYTSERPRVDLWELLFTDVAAKVLFCKSINWSHESELRIVAAQDNIAIASSSNHGFLVNMPFGIEVFEIVLGNRVDAELETTMLKIAKELGEKTSKFIPVKYAQPESTRYNILITDPINPQ